MIQNQQIQDIKRTKSNKKTTKAKNYYTAQQISLIDIVDQQNAFLNGHTPDDLIEGRKQHSQQKQYYEQ